MTTLSQIAQEIDQHLRAIQRTLRQPVESDFSRSGLTGPQRSVPQAVVRSGGLSLKDASRQVGLAHSTVSGIVDQLEKQGLVERHADQEDRRVNRIYRFQYSSRLCTRYFAGIARASAGGSVAPRDTRGAESDSGWLANFAQSDGLTVMKIFVPLCHGL